MQKILTNGSYVKSHADMSNPADRMNPDKSRPDLLHKFPSDNGWAIVISLKDLVNANEIIICQKYNSFLSEWISELFPWPTDLQT